MNEIVLELEEPPLIRLQVPRDHMTGDRLTVTIHFPAFFDAHLISHCRAWVIKVRFVSLYHCFIQRVKRRSESIIGKVVDKSIVLENCRLISLICR